MRNRFLCAMLLASSLLACAPDLLGQAPVGRRTTDLDQDLFQALVNANRFSDAIELCQARSRGADPRSDVAAKWAIRTSQALSAKQLVNETFTDTDIQAAQEPVSQLLSAYPDQARNFFLETQQRRVQRDAARHAVLRAAVSPSDKAQNEAAAGRLVRAASDMEALSERIDDERSRLSGNRDPDSQQQIADLTRLEQSLQVDLVSLSLLQTELFSRGSQDGIAAAVSAERAAVAAESKLPNGSAARREIERLRIESILRADQPKRADAAWKQAIEKETDLRSPQWLALRIRLDLALAKIPQVESQLAAFYGTTPGSAPLSVEMDLARLEYLLQSTQKGVVGPWLDEISKRGGPYARRRAEAWSLQYLKQSSVSNRPNVDPSIIAAQAKDWLRRGEASRAAELLSAAAAAETDMSRAISRAIEAAAAWKKAGSPIKAAEVLSDIALSKPQGLGAAAAHLQAIVLAATGNDSGLVGKVEAMLRRNRDQWPQGKAADGARRWLIKLLESQSRPTEAAVAATQVAAADLDSNQLSRILSQWRSAFRLIEPDQTSGFNTQLEEAFASLPKNPAVVDTHRLTFALVADRSWLLGVPSANAAEPPWIEALIEFRKAGKEDQVLSTIPETERADVIRRLMLDARAEPSRRRAIALLIEAWIDSRDSEPSLSLGQVERLLWLNQIPQAIGAASSLIKQSPDSAEAIQGVAELLGSSRDPEARKQAILWWDQLAAGSTAGSDVWHKAKLAAIQLLAATGQNDQARQRAKYILLTKPDLQLDLRRRYQAVGN